MMRGINGPRRLPSPIECAAVLLFFVWELGKLIARRTTDQSREGMPASA
jgi:hypothetical protein